MCSDLRMKLEMECISCKNRRFNQDGTVCCLNPQQHVKDSIKFSADERSRRINLWQPEGPIKIYKPEKEKGWGYPDHFRLSDKQVFCNGGNNAKSKEIV